MMATYKNNNCSVEKLNMNNFKEWRDGIYRILCANGLHHYVTNDKFKGPEGYKLISSEKGADKKGISEQSYFSTASIISSSVSSELKYLVNFYGAEDYMQGLRYKWDMIHRKFTPTEPSAVTHGLATIFSTQLQPGVTIKKHIADLQAAKK